MGRPTVTAIYLQNGTVFHLPAGAYDEAIRMWRNASKTPAQDHHLSAETLGGGHIEIEFRLVSAIQLLTPGYQDAVDLLWSDEEKEPWEE